MKALRTISLLFASFSLVACNKPSSTAEQKPGDEAPAPVASSTVTATPTSNIGKLPDVVSFNEHIQPIFADTCYHCHGPDSGTREPKSEPLRLDRPEYAFAPREDGKPVIKPGDPAGSTMIQLIKEKDPDIRMPPPEAHKEISAWQLALFERWIEQGAKYEEHWSFIPPVKAAVPEVKQKDWAKNPIDNFILDKLEQQNFAPNPVENPRRLYRRLNFDLTGLPPLPAAVDAFEKAFATNPDKAIADAADAMMASEQGAEHFSRQWLDAIRYADTHGIHIDNYRSIWPYRDWVINAFRNNMPWDQFTIEQIGGDLLANATLDQIVATGYGRCLPTTGEGGAIADEYFAIYAGDQVATTSAVWLGLSTQCAACHDHKFDPVSQKEFYQLTAFFRNTPMSGLDGNRADHPPNIFVPAMADRERSITIATEITTEEKNLAARQKTAEPDFQRWLTTASVPGATAPDPSLQLHLPFNESDGPFRGTLLGQPYENISPIARRDTPIGKALQANAQVLTIGDVGNFARKDSFTYSTFVFIEGEPTGAVFSRMDIKAGHRGWDFWLEAGKPAAHVIDTYPRKSSKIHAKDPLEANKWHHIAVVFDGSKPNEQYVRMFVNGQQINHETAQKNVGNNIQSKALFLVGGRTGGDNIGGNVSLQDLRIYNRAISAAEITALSTRMPLETILAMPAEQRTPQQTKALYQFFLAKHDTVGQGILAKIEALKKEQTEITARGAVSLIMQEKPNSEPSAHVLNRGSYADVGDKVGVGVPKVLHPMTDAMPKNRLGLGQWLVDKKNPLVGRVTVNRLWGYLYGTGIVETVEDFGIMGARPSHPKLLDWLAVEFMESGWNYRHMVKLMVTSATYRQSGAVSPEKLERDPLNRLLGRAPRYRLEAEPLRDGILHQANLLVQQVGGPSVKPYQPEGIWEAVAMTQSNTRNYVADTGEKLYRRSMYTLWKRTAPPASMEILNAPSRETFCVRRELTNTPLQAFVTMNDPQFVEAYRQLATLAIQSGSDPTARLQFIAQRLITRDLTAEEITTMQQTLATATKHYSANTEDATKLISIGASKADPQVPVAELASWTIVTNQIFNLDEALTK
jgi:hypothetical protein